MFEVTAELWYNCTIIIVHVEDHYFEDRRIASMKNLLTNLLLFASIVILFP